MSQAVHKEELLYSRLADDADLAEIVALFAEELPHRAALLQEHFQNGELDKLRSIAHQLKGAAGSYGFDALSPAAAKLEFAIRDGEPTAQIQSAMDELIDLCHRVRAGLPES